jgi:nitrite reductase/ring-hydroxylating ferredoxin subunit
VQQAATWLAERLPRDISVMYWLPGDVYEVPSSRYRRHPRWEDFSFSDVEAYLEEYAQDRAVHLGAMHQAYPDPGDGLGERFAEHFMRLGGLSRYFLERIGMTIRFEVQGPGGGRWDVHLGPGNTKVDLRGRARDVQYRFTVASRWLAPIIMGELAWEDLLLSLRFSAWRSPDVYNDYLIGLLKHAEPDALAAVEQYETSRDSNERFVVNGSDGRRYEVSRYCPHAGEDLAIGGVILGDVLRCLGHNFEFDLDTGACINARCDPLATRRLEAAVKYPSATN